MIKGSGINYFVSSYGLNDLWDVFYTFESGLSNSIPSESGAKSLYSGTVLGSTGSFWSVAGSGLLSGGYISINNQTGLVSNSFTHIFSFEEINTGRQLLFSNISNSSGYEIGLTDTKKAYFRSFDSAGPVVFASTQNLSSKNLLSVSYLNNYVEFGCYNFNSKDFEIDSYNSPVSRILSNSPAILASGFKGYLDYYLYFDLLLNKSTLNVIASGLYNIPTGYIYQVETICQNEITGYLNVPYFKTGIVGYSGGAFFDEGFAGFTGIFPTRMSASGITGILESGYISSGLIRSFCVDYTGSKKMGFTVLTGYSNTFQMDKILYLNNLSSTDILNVKKSNTPFDDNYNKVATYLYTGFYLDKIIESGYLNCWVNGVSLLNSGITQSQNFIWSDYFSEGDVLIVDSASGAKTIDISAPYIFNFTGQEIYFNGSNLISGYDFFMSGTNLILTGQNTGISGIVSEVPIFMRSSIYSGYLITGKLQKNTSRLFLNGVRQLINEDYIEGSKFDLLTGNSYNEYGNILFYDNDGTFWE